MPVNNQHPDYRRMADVWARCRDVAEGEDAVHAAQEKYLPKLQDQTPDEFKAYVMRAPFYNATWRTISGLVGMLFRKPPKVEVPAGVKPMLDDITLSGVPFHVLLQEVCEEALKCGRLGVLVDYPEVNAPDTTTLADVKSQNLRPSMQLYTAEHIINWRTARVNNVWVLTLVVLKEYEFIQKDEFTFEAAERFRVLDLAGNKQYRVRRFKMNGDQQEQLGSDLFPQMKGKPLDYIPFVVLSTDNTTSEVDAPPLIDLVNLNLSHYRSSADLEHGAHFTGLPTPWIAGYVPDKPGDKLYIGSQSVWALQDPNASAGFLEFTGQGLEALEKRCAAKEQQMAVLGARMLEPQKRGAETADSMSIHRKGEESMLSAAAQSISLGMQRALTWLASWADVAGKVEVELNRDFYPQAMTDKMLTALVSSWQSGAISDEVLFENLQAGEVISQETTFEEEQARLATQEPKLQGQEVDPVTGAPLAPKKLPKDAPPTPKTPRTTTITNPKGEKYTVQHD